MWAMNILVEPGNFGAVSIDENGADGYYIVKSVSIKTQYKNINSVKIIASTERFVNETELTNLIHESKCYTKIDGTEVVVPFHIIVHWKIKVFSPNCVDILPGNLCLKY